MSVEGLANTIWAKYSFLRYWDALGAVWLWFGECDSVFLGNGMSVDMVAANTTYTSWPEWGTCPDLATETARYC